MSPFVAAAVDAGVVDEVGDDARQAALVGADDEQLGLLADLHRRVAHRRHADGLAHELGHQQVLAHEPHGAGVEPGDLQQVLDQALEPGHVGHQQVEGGDRPLGHLVAARLQHLDRRRQRHQRRAQLVADVAGEAGVVLDPQLQRRRHVVEGGRQLAEVLVVGGLEAGVEAAAGDGLGGLGGVGQRAHRPARRPHAEQHAERRGEDGGAEQGHADAVQRALQLLAARRSRSSWRRPPAAGCRRPAPACPAPWRSCGPARLRRAPAPSARRGWPTRRTRT